VPTDLVRSAVRDVSHRAVQTPRGLVYVPSLTPMFTQSYRPKKLVE
jgi:hypothetical protein